MKRRTATIGWALVAALSWPWFGTQRPPIQGDTGLAGRWLGPIASLAASAEWVRWNTAVRRGAPERAWRHAERALALDPRSPQGWTLIAQHLVFDRAAAEVERDPARRVRFARAGLDLLRRGEERSSDPDALAVVAGDLAVFLAERAASDLPWTGGADALLDEAEAAYGRAAARGLAAAAGRLTRLRETRRAAGAQTEPGSGNDGAERPPDTPPPGR